MTKLEIPGENTVATRQDTRIALTIPISTYVGVISVCLLLIAFYMMWPLLQLIALGALLAATLSPMVDYLQRRNLSRDASLSLVIFVFLTLILCFFVIIMPTLFQQASSLSESFPEVRKKILESLPKNSFLHEYLQHLSEPPSQDSGKWYDQLNWAGAKVFNTLWGFGLLVVVAIYMLIDGPKLFRWFLAFFSTPTQQKFEKTAEQSSEVIFLYVYGQMITSGLVMIFSFVVLYTLNVPAALILALCAAILDIFPVVGFILATVPAVLLALTVSPITALIVAIAYILYDVLENYYIVPKVYGQKLRLSTFTVLISLLVGWELAGIAGALLALPLVASYAHIEAIWLTPYLNRHVVKKHEDQKEEEFGEKVPATSPIPIVLP